MKKNLILFISFILPFSPSLHAFENNQEIYGGYIYVKIKNHKANCAIISYHYGSDIHWGMLLSLLHIKSTHQSHFIDASSLKLGTKDEHAKVSALLIGPTYRITPSLAIYAQMGPKKLKYRVDKSYSGVAVTDTIIVDTTNVMFQAGIDYSLRKNVGINLGYLHSDTESNKHNIRLNSIQLSLGYRF